MQESERKCVSLEKYTARSKQETARLQKRNTELSMRVKELEQEGQALRKVRVCGRKGRKGVVGRKDVEGKEGCGCKGKRGKEEYVV